MNRQQIETTPAGPELDALVAEAAKWDHNHKIRECEDGFYNYCEYCGYEPRFMEPEPGGCTGFPPYSTDIDKAWELVEELSSEYEITINRHPPDGQITCSALFIIGPDADFEKWYLGEGQAAPEAITRAYLLAKLEG